MLVPPKKSPKPQQSDSGRQVPTPDIQTGYAFTADGFLGDVQGPTLF